MNSLRRGHRGAFDKLATAVKQQLSGVKVYKVGDEPEKSVFIVGKTPGGKWPGSRPAWLRRRRGHGPP
jgi:hypothetical protein